MCTSIVNLLDMVLSVFFKPTDYSCSLDFYTFTNFWSVCSIGDLERHMKFSYSNYRFTVVLWVMTVYSELLLGLQICTYSVYSKLASCHYNMSLFIYNNNSTLKIININLAIYPCLYCWCFTILLKLFVHSVRVGTQGLEHAKKVLHTPALFLTPLNDNSTHGVESLPAAYCSF